jgi:hypothetical protein
VIRILPGQRPGHILPGRQSQACAGPDRPRQANLPTSRDRGSLKRRHRPFGISEKTRHGGCAPGQPASSGTASRKAATVCGRVTGRAGRPTVLGGEPSAGGRGLDVLACLAPGLPALPGSAAASSSLAAAVRSWVTAARKRRAASRPRARMRVSASLARHWHHARWMRRPPMRTGCTRTKCSHSAPGHGSAPALMIEARSASVST